jgi:hypothetical protein
MVREKNKGGREGSAAGLRLDVNVVEAGDAFDNQWRCPATFNHSPVLVRMIIIPTSTPKPSL